MWKYCLCWTVLIYFVGGSFIIYATFKIAEVIAWTV